MDHLVESFVVLINNVEQSRLKSFLLAQHLLEVVFHGFVFLAKCLFFPQDTVKVLVRFKKFRLEFTYVFFGMGIHRIQL